MRIIIFERNFLFAKYEYIVLDCLAYVEKKPNYLFMEVGTYLLYFYFVRTLAKNNSLLFPNFGRFH